jgi:hypothetical protein
MKVLPAYIVQAENIGMIFTITVWGPVAGSCEHSDEYLSSINCGGIYCLSVNLSRRTLLHGVILTVVVTQ